MKLVLLSRHSLFVAAVVAAAAAVVVLVLVLVVVVVLASSLSSLGFDAPAIGGVLTRAGRWV